MSCEAGRNILSKTQLITDCNDDVKLHFIAIYNLDVFFLCYQFHIIYTYILLIEGLSLLSG